eukprot:3024824-Pyramimonas_sp.AAC.1
MPRLAGLETPGGRWVSRLARPAHRGCAGLQGSPRAGPPPLLAPHAAASGPSDCKGCGHAGVWSPIGA